MAVVKRRPFPRTNDFQKKEESVERKMPTEPRRPLFEAMKEQTNELEIKKIEEGISKSNEINSIEKNKSYDLENFRPALSKTKTRSNLKSGVISIINSNCGKRVIISASVMDKLNNTTKVSISFSDERIAIGEMLPNNTNQLNVKITGKNGVIYSAGIVNEITNLYGLDFSNRTSITFSEVEYIENEGCTVAIINTR